MDEYRDIQILKAPTTKETVTSLFQRMTQKELHPILSPKAHFYEQNYGHQLIDYLPTHWVYSYYDGGEYLFIWDSLAQPIETYQQAANIKKIKYLSNGTMFQLPTGMDVMNWDRNARNISTCGLWACVAGYLFDKNREISEPLLNFYEIRPVNIDESNYEEELDKNSNNFILRLNEYKLQDIIKKFVNTKNMILDFYVNE